MPVRTLTPTRSVNAGECDPSEPWLANRSREVRMPTSTDWKLVLVGASIPVQRTYVVVVEVEPCCVDLVHVLLN
jgi:hypothetical protein